MSKKMKRPKVGTVEEKDNGVAVSKSDTESEAQAETQSEPFPQDMVKKLDPLELEKFCRFEAEIRTCVQGMRIVELELLEIKRTLQARAQEAHQRRAMLENELNQKWKIGYDTFCMSLAQKYGISKPAHILIDTDAGTIRDSGEI